MSRIQEWKKKHSGTITVERVQTGVRLEKRILKVLKALAEYLDISLGDLLEGITLHAFEGRAPFSRPTLHRIAALRQVYGLTLRASDSHRLVEGARERRGGRPSPVRSSRRAAPRVKDAKRRSAGRRGRV